jgi:parvulin-like peptidyl-prolyl isomerase
MNKSITPSMQPDAARFGARAWRAAGFVLALGWLALFVAEARAADGKLADGAFARVADVTISQADYDRAFAVASRSKFYHGKPPEAEVARLQREVGQKLIDDILLAREAKRRKIQPDADAIQRTLDGYDAQYKASAQWQKNRERMLPELRRKMEADSLVAQLEKQVRGTPKPTDKQVEAYYAQNKDKFTEPEQVRLSMILLKVDPSSPQAKWDGARDEGQAVVKRLRAGADFAELAKVHSGDVSADKGGDLGYVHQGMLPEPAQVAIDKMKPGDISEAVFLLEGVAVFRLEERKEARLNPLAKVRDRAEGLWARDRGDETWKALIERLRRGTPAVVDESRYLPLAAKAATSPGSNAR